MDNTVGILSSEPELLAVASFLESNPFGHIVNGESNAMEVKVENNSGKNTTLHSIAGGLYSPGSDSLIKPTNNITYGLYLLEGAKVTLPYHFHSELKAGDVNLRLEIEHITDGIRHRATVFNSNVTVVEPELSIFDFKLLSTYFMVTALLGGLGYLAYITFVPQPKKARKPVAVPPPEVETVTGTATYQEEWIPEHHLRKGKKASTAHSGDEPSGGEMSGTEGKRRKGRK
ncbi:hypothetical protein K488DRAFT_49705 [Vararia minispora EC-137]|uniref:Uncharacterized protein n=1 Tax=Vararia minispora EC-137 TaxID=1314806 RepID=A0ACB8QL40_9AGAM|nr:hypothetical protein K488DRAFT_49705 [Vararia minispora EC-137]